MQRRGLLARLGAVAGLGSLAGCSGGSAPTGPAEPPKSPTLTPTPTSGIVIESWNVKNGTDGALVVPITLKNTGDRPGSRKVFVDLSVGNESYAVEREVQLGADESTQINITFEVTFRAFLQDGSLDLRLEGE